MKTWAKRALVFTGILIMLFLVHCTLIACSDAYTAAVNRTLWRASAAIHYAFAPCDETLEEAVDRAKTVHSEENIYVLENDKGAVVFDQTGLIGGRLVFQSDRGWRTLELSYCRNLFYPSDSARNGSFSILALQWDGTVYLLGQVFSETSDVKVFDADGRAIPAMCFSDGLNDAADERYGAVVFRTMDSLEPGYWIRAGSETLVFLGEGWSHDANGIPGEDGWPS